MVPSVPAAHSGVTYVPPEHVFLHLDREDDMRKFIEKCKRHGLPPTDFAQLFDKTGILLEDQGFDDEYGYTFYLCRRCGESHPLRHWQSHVCCPLLVTFLAPARPGTLPPRPSDAPPASADTTLMMLREGARMGSKPYRLVWDLVSEHVIELYLQFQTHTTIDMGLLLDSHLISPRILAAAPKREENLRAVVAEETYDDSD